jgi:molecular chaperone GrpE
MGELGEPANAATGSEERIESPASEGEWPSAGDELDLAVIEGLGVAETAAALAPGPDQVPAAAAGASAGAAEATAGLVEAVAELKDQLSRRLDAVQTILERELRAEAARERVVDRLHAELQEYKQDLLLKVQRPIFLDLIQLHDDIGKMIEARPPQDADPGRTPDLRGILESIQTAIEDILYRQGVEPFVLDGDAFDARKQRAVATVPTDDPARNKLIAARLRKGFQAGEKLIRPEVVSVFTLRPAPVSAPADSRREDVGEPDPVVSPTESEPPVEPVV